MKEIEYKFILDKKTKNQLEKFLKKNKAKFLGQEKQENYYYQASGKNDFRIRKTDNCAFIILKKGWMHDDDREEIEIKIDRKDFQKADKIFTSLGFKYDTKWYRVRKEYRYKDFNISIDFNAGYGWIAEIEKIVRKGHEEKAKKDILQLARIVNIKPASKSLFDKMYKYYKNNWPYYFDSKTTFDIKKIK